MKLDITLYDEDMIDFQTTFKKVLKNIKQTTVKMFFFIKLEMFSRGRHLTISFFVYSDSSIVK